MIRPRLLREGDSIAIISPASEIASFPRRTRRGLIAMSDMGYRPACAPHALKAHGHDAGTPQQRAADIQYAFANDEYDAVVASTGGYTSLTVLQHLDFSAIAQRPKIFVGHSDVTALLLAIHARAGLVTFHGPTLLPSFGDAAGIHPQTAWWFNRVLRHCEGTLAYPSSLSVFSDDEIHWDKDDDRPREYAPDTGAAAITAGVAEGRLIGGNLDTLLLLALTPFFPDLEGCILFIEEIGGTTSKTIRGLQALEHAGILARIVGLVSGRRFKYEDSSEPAGIRSALKAIGTKYGIPVLDNMPIGHTEPKLTLPIGVLARLDSQSRELSLLEPAVVRG
jgi:muramoyltetrapeptide carboxypeptidase